MGFKRTPEGRVFFQGADNIGNKGPNTDEPAKKRAPLTANDAPAPRPQNRTQAPLTRNTSDQTQLQIVALLKSLNERLKTTQAERDKMMAELEKYRGTIEDLEDKSSRNERLTLDLEHQLQQSRKTGGAPSPKTLEAEKIAKQTLQELQKTRKHLTEMEQKQREQNESLAEKVSKSGANYAALSRRIKDTEERQTELDDKVETAVSQQAKLLRKVDKAIEDRVRFMRKIERIEETVIQTRDSLNAKAMVLLTEQGAAAEGAVTDIPENTETPIKNQETLAAIKQPFTPEPLSVEQEKIYKRQTVMAIAAMIAIGIGGGLLWNAFQGRSAAPIETQSTIEQSAQTQDITDTWQAAEFAPQSGEPETSPATSPAAPIAALDWAIEDTQSVQQEPETAPIEQAIAETTDHTTNDVGTIDLQNEEQVAALLENNPQALAQELNAIEPQNLKPAEVKPEPATAPTVAKVPTNKVTAIKSDALPTKSEQQLRDAINPDSSLPNTIKTIEDQAFKGVAEAQHDLAAIYTAGHGGVKQNYNRAGFWFERAAEGGVPNASYNLGVLHHQGLGFKPSVDSAINWYERAASQGHPEAQYNLGIAYIEGIGVTYDPERAAEFFANAANNGIMEAAYNLGLIYENGLLGQAKPNEALIWYKTAADQGSPEGKQALEELSRNLGISARDVNRIVDEARAAAPQKESNAVIETRPVQNSVISNTNDNEQALIAQIQEYLMRSGLYPGPADGVSGALTQDAIRSYQSQNNLTSDGIPTQSLLSHMLSNGNEQGSRY